jgi:glycosyltransferase involved in cell wall biosynthesis
MPSTKRAKVFFDASSLRYLHTGLGQFEFNLLKEFATASNPGFELSALVHPAHSRHVPAGINALPTTWLRRHSPASFQKHLYPRCDVWHITDENTRLTGIAPAAKVILTIHGLHFLDEDEPVVAQQKLQRVQRLVKRAAVITAVSEFTAKLIAANLDVRGKEIKVIANGISLPEASHLHAPRPSWAPQGKFIFAVGTFFKRKNFHVLIPMMKYLPEVTLVLAGDDKRDYGRHVKKEIEVAGLTNRILMPGEISESEKIWLYQQGEAMMFPSVSEGFGIPVIECFSFGKPVLCSRYGSLPEVGGNYASYWDDFDPATMAKMVTQTLSQENASKNESRMSYARTFTWSKSAAAYLDLYRSLIG